MGQESSLLPRNPYENYPNKSNHQKFIISDSEHYSNLTKFHKSKLNFTSSNNSINTTTTTTTTSTHHQLNRKKSNHYQRVNSPTIIYDNSYNNNNSWNCNTNNITIVDQIPKYLPPPPPPPPPLPLPISKQLSPLPSLPCSNRSSEFGFDRFQRIKKSTSRSSFASYTDYSSCYCSSNSSALSSASKKSQEKQANYLNHHLYIKSYLDIVEEDEKAKKQFKPRPGIRNYTPKILSCESSIVSTSTALSSSASSENTVRNISNRSKEPDIWI